MRRHLLKVACLAAAPLGGFLAGYANAAGFAPALYPFVATLGVLLSCGAVVAFAALEIADERRAAARLVRQEEGSTW